jgi:hypothetical protein
LRQRHDFEHGFPLIRSLRASAQRSTSVLFSFVLSVDCGRTISIRRSKTILARSCEAHRISVSGCQTWSGERLRLCFVTLRCEEIDWAGLRAAAVAIGIRPAARQAAHDLPPDERDRFVQRAMKRCSREKWLAKAQQDKADAVAASPTALSANVRKCSDVLSEVLAEDSRRTRLGLSAAARNAAETFAKMPGSKVIKHAQAHRHLTASSSVLHGWDDKGNPIPFTLNVLNINSLNVEQDPI